MKKENIIYIFLLMIFLPMPFVWYGYGEKGYYGYSILQNMYFLGGWCFILASRIIKNRFMKYIRTAGEAFVLFGYFSAVNDFIGHLPKLLFPLDVCKLPMWISFLGAVGMFFLYWYFYERKEGDELK